MRLLNVLRLVLLRAGTAVDAVRAAVRASMAGGASEARRGEAGAMELVGG